MIATSETAYNSLEPLFLPYEEPNKHRVKPKKDGAKSSIEACRRPSQLHIVQNLRAEVSQWRMTGYPGASQTTRELLSHWFERDHKLSNADGDTYPFRYYFCQREAIETFIFLYECRGIYTLSALTANYGSGSEEERTTTALGIAPEEDQICRYAFKIATGAGKTKVMSLAMVWSYFHAKYEPDSTLPKHFLLIAPNLIVFERLKEDFEGGKIFAADPLVPPAWKADFNLSVALQDDTVGLVTDGIVYLTNIHRLYDTSTRKKTRDDDAYEWMGPSVSKNRSTDTSKRLREQIAKHPRLLVINDEAHHVWDQDSAWNICISDLQKKIWDQTGENTLIQLDFSATPKDNKGNLFKHIVTEAPLGEAIDGGIVKTPIIGSGKITERTDENAAIKYQHHLLLGYDRWLDSFEEWSKSNKKALMFVMTEDAEAADQIAYELNTNPSFKVLNGKTLNLHTRLKGKVKKKGKGRDTYFVFEESENAITGEDLEFLRDLARDLDSDTSPYRCIVSVLMLREGWDVKNVTTIVPLRAYSSKANILPEQTLGRGLRRMTPPGQANELVTVVEHPSFANLYKEELAQQGVIIDIVDVTRVPRTSVSIFPDAEKKDLAKLELLIPRISQGFSRKASLDGLTFDDIKNAFAKYKPLPIGEKSSTIIQYQGKHLITDEVIQEMAIQLPLLQHPGGCISFYRTELERQTKLVGLKSILDNLLERFIQELLFEQPVSIWDSSVLSRFSDDDVREHIRATFVPLIQAKTTFKEERRADATPIPVSGWKAFQVSQSASRPVVQAARTLFNLVTCNQQLESALSQFLDKAPDVAAFCKNAGPQALRIDYLNSAGQLAMYTADFIVRSNDNKYFLLEAKGREDRDVPLKAKAAVEWCKAASSKKVTWEYVYVTDSIFQTFSRDSLAALARTSAPSLMEMLSESSTQQLKLPLAQITAQAQTKTAFDSFITEQILEALPPTYKTPITEAITLYSFCENQKGFSFASVFTPLLKPIDTSCVLLISNALQQYVPTNPMEQQNFFDAGSSRLSERAQNLKKTLVWKSGISPIGLLKFCLTFENKENLGGVFKVIPPVFKVLAESELPAHIEDINDFRNNYIAHQNYVLNDPKQAQTNLKHWISTLLILHKINSAAASGRTS